MASAGGVTPSTVWSPGVSPAPTPHDEARMDSDLAEATQALKDIFQKRYIPASFMPGDEALVATLVRELDLSDRYASFLRAADPLDVETATLAERVRFIPAAELLAEQVGYGRGDGETGSMAGWKPEWVVIAHSALLGDPYFLDTTRPDAEGDCPVMTAMMGTDRLEPVLCATNLVTFLQILAKAMEVAEGFADDALDPDDEHIFREALVPHVRVIDPAALRGGHWTP